jgi:hypothetical protein
MIAVNKYISEILGENISIHPISKKELGNLPMYITQSYKLYNTNLFNKEVIVVEPYNEDELSIFQIDKHLHLISNNLNANVILILENLLSYNRKRLIEKKISFIVPGKQMYLPELLIDLRENFSQSKSKPKDGKLMPSAQMLLLYHIVNRYNGLQLENYSFKEIAKKLNYTAMAITNAVEDLKYHDLINVKGEKEKFIKFNFERNELWYKAVQNNLLSSPIIKTIYTDSLPDKPFMLRCNATALHEYSDMNPSRQKHYAIDKNTFYDWQKNQKLVNANDKEGTYAIEVWKYNPYIIAEDMGNELPVVDPLSLYLSLKDNHDERIEMALEQIIEKFIW